MIKVVLIKHIFRDFETKEMGCWAYKVLKIPFSPFPDLMIYDGYEKHKIFQVEWNGWEKKTYCRILPQYPMNDYESEKKTAIHERWVIRQVDAGKKVENIADIYNL